MNKFSSAFIFAFFLLTFFFSVPLFSQENLISNPGFEVGSNKITNQFTLDEVEVVNRTEYGTLIPGEAPPIFFVSGWTHPTVARPDYWYGNQKVKTDDRYFSPSAAHSGNGRAGIAIYTSNDEDGDEDDKQYLQTKLKAPLVTGQKYYFEFYLKLEWASEFSADNISVLFSTDQISPDSSMIGNPQIKIISPTELKSFIAQEGAGTKISLITFGSGIKVLCRAAILKDTSSIDSLIGSMQEGGATNIEKALTTGYAIADSVNDPAAKTQIVLFSDAEFQLNKHEEKMIRHFAKEKKIVLVVYHYGKHVNEELEKTLTKCNAHYAKAGDADFSKVIRGDDDQKCGCN